MIRAAVFDGPGKPLRIQEFPRPKVGPGEALVRVTLATVCGSDLHTVSGRRPGPTPCVLGHEAVGVVEKAGPGLLDVRGDPVGCGDRVVWGVAASCGQCFFCGVGLSQKCEHLRKYGHEPVRPGGGPHGALTTHCHLFPGSAVVRVPARLPDAVAAPAACATATVMGALRGVRRDTPGHCLVVSGLGMLGLSACAAAGDSLQHGPHIIACDSDPGRLARAREFGASHACRPDELAELARSLTGGRGADTVVELSGSPAAAALSLDVLRVGGAAVWVGAVFPTPAVPVSPETVVRRCLSLTGIHNYGPQDLADAVGFLHSANDRFPFAGLVEEAFTLDQVNDALRYAEHARPVRVGIAP